MDERDPEHLGYAERVRQNTQDVMKNVRKVLSDNEALCVTAAELEIENERLQAEVEALRREIEEHRIRETRLQERLREIHRDGEQYARQVEELESQHMMLASLYAASHQLHGTLEREAVVTSIQEIVVNLIGSEDFGVFEYTDSGRFRHICSVGLDEIECERTEAAINAMSGAIHRGDLLLECEIIRDWVACIPLTIDARLTGAIAIRSLFPHKPQLEPGDIELFELLAKHAAIALYSTALHALAQNGAAA